MLENIWLPILAGKFIFSQFFSSTVLAIIITFLLFFDYCLICIKKCAIKKSDIFILCLLPLAVVFRNQILTFDILICCRLLLDVKIDKLMFYKFFFEIFSILLLLYELVKGNLSDSLTVYAKRNLPLHSLGFGNANSAALFFFYFMTTLLLFWKRFNCSIFLFLSLLLNLLIYKLCYSRTVFFTVIMIAFIMLLEKSKNLNCLLKKFGKYAGALCVNMTFLLPILAYTIPSFSRLKQAFTGSFFYFYAILSHLNLKTLLFGFKYAEDAPLDSSYILMLITGGIFLVIYFIRIFYRALKSDKDIINQADVPFVIGMAIAGFTESFVVSTSLTSLLFWFILISRSKNITAQNNNRRKHKCLKYLLS